MAREPFDNSQCLNTAKTTSQRTDRQVTRPTTQLTPPPGLRNYYEDEDAEIERKLRGNTGETGGIL